MARNEGLEKVIRDALGELPGLVETTMFGGRAWLLCGHLLCAVRADGLLVRLGNSNDAWALAIAGITPMIMRDRPLQGWVRAASSAFGEEALRERLLAAALAFVRTLPPKPTSPPPRGRRPRR